VSTSDDSATRSDPNGPEPTIRRSPPNAVALIGLGLANACCVAAGLALGWFLDRELGTAPVFILLGIASGIVLGIIGTLTQVRRFLRDN
jgi:ATP synthase protein I